MYIFTLCTCKDIILISSKDYLFDSFCVLKMGIVTSTLPQSTNFDRKYVPGFNVQLKYIFILEIFSGRVNLPECNPNI